MLAWVTGKEGQLQTLKSILIYIAASFSHAYSRKHVKWVRLKS